MSLEGQLDENVEDLRSVQAEPPQPEAGQAEQQNSAPAAPAPEKNVSRTQIILAVCGLAAVLAVIYFFLQKSGPKPPPLPPLSPPTQPR